MEFNSNSTFETPILYNFDQPRYAEIYQVKFQGELVYVYVEFYNVSPSFEEFTNAVKLKCKICDNFGITIKDDKGCVIPDSITFTYFMRNTYNPQVFFEITISQSNELPAVDVASASDTQIQFSPIYENPDKFFVYFLSKDLINYFKHQTQIICTPTGAELIEKYYIVGCPNLEVGHKKSIIQVSANHLMLVKHNEPSIQDRVIWAKVICEIFPQLRDSNTDEYYFAVYNEQKGDGYLGNRVKLLMKAIKKAKENKAAIEKKITPPIEELIEENNDIERDLQNLVIFMKVAEVSTDKAQIVENHKKTFSIRQHYRKKKDIATLVSEFPRFFDVDGLIDEDFAQLYPLSGLVTFTQEIQTRICKIAQESKNYSRFPLTHQNLAQPLNALLHLIILLPPTSLGRGQKNRVKLELAFPRLVKIHEVNQPLIDVTKDNPEKTPFIVASGPNYYVVYDNQFIKCQTSFSAIDIFFKVHSVFDQKFDSNIRHVLGFVEYYFYNIKKITPTSEMRLISSRLFSN